MKLVEYINNKIKQISTTPFNNLHFNKIKLKKQKEDGNIVIILNGPYIDKDTFDLVMDAIIENDDILPEDISLRFDVSNNHGMTNVHSVYIDGKQIILENIVIFNTDIK